MSKPCTEAIAVGKALPGLEHETVVTLQAKGDKHTMRIDGIELSVGSVRVEIGLNWAWPMVYINEQRVLYRTTVMRNGSLIAIDPGLLREREVFTKSPVIRLERIEMGPEPVVLGVGWQDGMDDHNAAVEA